MIGPADTLDNLERLDRDLLYLFLIGPGRGEGLGIALPGTGWVLVDGCQLPLRRGRPVALPLIEAYQRWSREDDPVKTYALTHPHDDHVGGVADLLERFDPQHVGVTGTDEPVETLVDLAEMLAHEASAGPAADTLVARRVLSAIRAINRWHALHPDGLVSLHEGGLLPINTEPAADGEVRILAHAPDPTFVREVWSWSPERRGAFLTGHANWLSTVLEVQYGEARIVLGGDLPCTVNGEEVPTGWPRVLGLVPQLCHHHGLKIPHHGSREALHEDLLSPGRGTSRAWLVTPFNSSRIPRPDDLDGLHLLLMEGDLVHQTSLSWSRALCRAGEEHRISREELREDLAQTLARETFRPTDTVLRRVEHHEPLDPVWVVAFARDGMIAGRWYGRAAFEIHP